MTTNRWRSGYRKLGLVGVLAVGGMVTGERDRVLAQIVLDDTLGSESSVVTPNVNINGLPSDKIDGGAQRGTNLFHSFQEFNISENQRVYFSSPNGIENILSRVTGSNPSNILGTLGVTGGNANLFLINPNGIIFGSDARLDVNGSFVATTANAIQFNNQGFFSASAPNIPPVLTVNPSAFLFNQTANGSIENRSVAPAGTSSSGDVFGLRVPDGQSLLFLGGNISIDSGGIIAFGGRVDLGGVAGAGTVELNLDNNNLSLSFPESISRADVALTNGGGVIVAADEGGDIAINARNIGVLGGSSLDAGIGRGLGFISAQAGNIKLDATEAVTVADGFILNYVGRGAVGNAGDITIETGQLNLKDGGQVAAFTNGNGNTGELLVQARELVEVTSGGLLTNQVNLGTGNAGDLTIETGSLFVTNGGEISASTFGQGNAGSLNISARDMVSLDDGDSNSFISNNVGSEAIGNSGGINITTGSLFVTNGAQIQSLTQGQGNAGKITIVGSDTVSFVDGKDGVPSGAFSIVNSGGRGNAGGLDITANSLFLTNRGQLGSWTSGIGNSGDIFIYVQDQVALLNSNILTEVSEAENIGAQSGVGNGGNIKITTGFLSLKDGSALLADTENRGDAGNIVIEARGGVILEGLGPSSLDPSNIVPSQISSTVASNAVGEGGNVSISTDLLSITNNGFVSSETYGQGNAGDLTIDSRTLNVDSSQISSSTFGTGNAGDLIVRATDSVVLNGEIPGEGGEAVSPGGLLAQVNRTGEGSGGNLILETRRLSVSNGSKVQVATFGQGDAGELLIRASEVEIFNTIPTSFFTGIFAGIQQDPRSEILPQGNGGKLTIETEQLSIRNGGRVEANTLGKGDAGDLFIQATELVEVVGTQENALPSFLGAEVGTFEVATPVNPEAITGKGGDVIINTRQLSIRDGGKVSVSTSARGDAGNILVQAGDSVEVVGTSSNGIRSSLSGDVNEGATGTGGDLTIKTRRLSVIDGSEVSVRTDGEGDAGELQIDANESVEVIGISTNGRLHSELSAAVGSTAIGQGGDLSINTRQLAVKDGAEVSASTASSGQGGTVTVTAPESVTLSGGGRLSAQAIAGGNAGDLTINTDLLTVQDEAEITVSSPQGQAGDLTVTANSISLDRGNITAITGKSQQGEEGANITLQVQDLLLIGNESQISADALETANGGNINIDTDFLIALPPQGDNGSDIRANAVEGNGGRLNITAQGILGIQQREEQTAFNDITASSQLGVDGTVEINTPDVDLQSSLTELAANFASPDQVVAGSCLARRNVERGSFTITGTGGLPSSPYEAVSGRYAVSRIQPIQGSSKISSGAVATKDSSSWKLGDPIDEAQGMTVTAEGRLILGTTPQLIAVAKTIDLVCK